MKSNFPISRELMRKIVDEVFDGAIEDASVIEEIYACIKRHEAEDKRYKSDNDIARTALSVFRKVASTYGNENEMAAPIAQALSDERSRWI